MELCEDPTCTRISQAVDLAQAREYTPTLPLPSGVVFWRLRSIEQGQPSAVAGAPRMHVVATGDGNAPFAPLCATSLNGDAYGELIVGQPERDRVIIRLGSAAGLDAQETTVVGPAASGFGRVMRSVGDLNDDGFSDLVLGEPSLGRIDVLRGAALLTRLPPLNTFTASQPGFGRWVEALGDTDGDGLPDVAIGADDAITLGYGHRAADLVLSPLELGSGGVVGALGGGDFDGDGLSDFWVQRRDGHLALVRGHTRGATLMPVETTLRASLADAFFADITGDGRGELIVPGQRYYVLGNATLLTDTTAFSLDGAPSRFGDFNGDGLTDAVIVSQAPAAVTLRPGTAQVASFGSPATTALTGAPAALAMSAQDFNGDGLEDLVLRTGADTATLVVGGSAFGVRERITPSAASQLP